MLTPLPKNASRDERAPQRRNQVHVLHEPERCQITGVPTSSWCALQAKGSAPRPFPLKARSMGWSFNELIEWVEVHKDWRANWQTIGEAAARVVSKLK
jgi:predicted DNA-binding transcriptional regulator AlpA